MKDSHAEHLLRELPLCGSDAARLILEAIEDMPELSAAAAQGKAALMQALRRVLRAGVEAVREQEQTVSFREAAAESLARRVAAGRRATTLRDLRHFIKRLLRVPGFAERPLRAIRPAECRRVLEEAFGASAHSFRKGRAILHSVFAYGMRQQWCRENPVAAVEVPPVQEREIAPLSLTQCRRLVEVAKSPRFRDCLPALGLMLFAGVRPGEVARLRWGDVCCEEGVLSIAARHSKTGGARRVELCPPLRRLLRHQRPGVGVHGCSGAAADAAQLPLCPPHWPQRWQLLRQAAGFGRRGHAGSARWVPDVLRHTFASYHALTHRNLPALQLQLGHRDSRLLLTRYLNTRPLRRAEMAPFWNLLSA